MTKEIEKRVMGKLEGKHTTVSEIISLTIAECTNSFKNPKHRNELNEVKAYQKGYNTAVQEMKEEINRFIKMEQIDLSNASEHEDNIVNLCKDRIDLLTALKQKLDQMVNKK